MTQEELEKQQKRLEAIYDMTTHPGWKHFQDDLQEAFDARNNVLGVETQEALYTIRGQLQAWQNILNTREIARHHLGEVEKQLAGEAPSEPSLVDDIPEEGHEQL